MSDYRSLNHSRWECQYHVVFIPKYRKKRIFGQIKRYLGEVFHRLARQKESLIEEGHLMSDHVHMLISIPPKYSVAQVVGCIKERARSTSRDRIEVGATQRDSISGPAATSWRP